MGKPKVHVHKLGVVAGLFLAPAEFQKLLRDWQASNVDGFYAIPFKRQPRDPSKTVPYLHASLSICHIRFYDNSGVVRIKGLAKGDAFSVNGQPLSFLLSNGLHCKQK
jgi:hypothetical protein